MYEKNVWWFPIKLGRETLPSRFEIKPKQTTQINQILNQNKYISLLRIPVQQSYIYNVYIELVIRMLIKIR